MSRQRCPRRCHQQHQHHNCTFCGARRSVPRHQENRWIWRRRGEHDRCAWRSGVLYLATPRRDQPAKLRKPKFDQRVGSEQFTQDRDVGSANDHHAPVERQMETERHAGERDKNPTSEKSTRQESCVRELKPPAKGAPRCTDLPSGTVAQMENKAITQRKCTKWRGPSGKPWSDWHKSSLSFRIGSYVELVDDVALQTKHVLLQQHDGETKRQEKGSCKQPPQQSCKESENPSGPSEQWRSSLTRHHPLNESIRKHRPPTQ